ncbi:hypothetical protein BKA81DRAFT_145943 [Phyllosticta paracitricarpa]
MGWRKMLCWVPALSRSSVWTADWKDASVSVRASQSNGIIQRDCTQCAHANHPNRPIHSQGLEVPSPSPPLKTSSPPFRRRCDAATPFHLPPA